MQLEELYRSRIFQVFFGLACILAIYIYFPAEQQEGLIIQGTVTLNGTKLPDGTISFIPVETDSGKASGGIINNGTYDTGHQRGILPGKYRVEIYSYEGGNEPTGEIHSSRIPASWNTKSEHVITVTEDNLKYDFEVLSEE